MKTQVPMPTHRHQRGAVVLVFALTLLVLIGFAGLAIDLGRFFVIKSELQNAMDACALSAASQLRPGQNNPTALTKAVAYGQVFSTGNSAIQNRANFQNVAVTIAADQITFSETLNGSYQVSTLANYNTAKYAKCEYPLAGLPIFFMRVLNPSLSTQTVSAMAAATLAPSSSNCAIPVGVCKAPGSNAANNFGLTVGDWLSTKSSSPYGTGNFGWVDFTPPAGGASELAGLLTGSGQCELKTGVPVGESGNIASLDSAWNSRFGWYNNKYKITEAPPDFTGYAYSKENWPNEFNAYSGAPGNNPLVPGAVNFETARAGHIPYQGNTPQGIPSNTYASTSSSGHAAYGQNRRLAVAPVVDCTVWNTGSAQPSVEDWACVLMLRPMVSSPPPNAANPGEWDVAKLEFLGLSSTPGSPCATAGGAGTAGPLVPVLVQ